MQTPNENGVYKTEHVEEMARLGRSYAQVELCQCQDGLYRYALDVSYSYGGFGWGISDDSEGFATYKAAKDAGLQQLVRCFPQPRQWEPESVQRELRDMKAQMERHVMQPSLF